MQPGIAEGQRRAATAAAASRDRSLCGCSSAISEPQSTTKNSSHQKPGTSHLFLSRRKSSGPNPALNFSLNWKHMVSITVGDALCLGSSHQGFKWVFSCRVISSFFIFLSPNNPWGVQNAVLSGTRSTSISRVYQPLNGASPSLPWDVLVFPLVCSLALDICRKNRSKIA